MYKFKATYPAIALLVFTAVFFSSCNEDFNTLDSAIEIDDNFNTSLQKYNVKAYTKKLDPVQTNGLPINLIGVYKDGYGTTASSVVSQVAPAEFDPTFPCGTTFDSIVLNIPYFSASNGVDDEGNSTFTLDSVIGNQPIRLSIFKSNYFLRDFQVDGDFDEGLSYFSNQTTSENSPVMSSDLEQELLYRDETFETDARQIRFVNEDDDITARANPAIRVKLNIDPDPEDELEDGVEVFKTLGFWEDLILSREDQPELSNINNFTDYFRGIYIKAEAQNDDGTLMLLNLANGASIEMYYSVKDEDGDTIPDYADADFDCDGDLIPDHADSDPDGDGINNNGLDLSLIHI